ncbi:dihydropteroate synthase [Flavobacteriaceae bacterium MAR_2010_188]|nr:dihydropteroate synthase [Flavobacteriaceae bacterium MAR_2010_188]
MTINCKGKLVDLETPKVMGILNMTPDSFYDGGSLKSDADVLNKTEKMLKEGATFIDIGGYSSRPGAADIEIDEELKRVVPIIEKVLLNFPETIISIDTFRSEVAKNAVLSGAAIVNDISAGNLDKNMMLTVGALHVPYIMMHMKGTPQNMKSQTDYEDLIHDLIFYFSQKIAEAKSHNIIDMIVDPGFGFAKTLSQNYEILKNLELFQNLDKAILVGLSRKSMVYKPFNGGVKDALNATTSTNTIALQKGAKILRVHDVKEAMECVEIHKMLN